MVEYLVQVNGKVCGWVVVVVDIDEEMLKVVVLIDEKVQVFLVGVILCKVIVVVGWLVNFVIQVVLVVLMVGEVICGVVCCMCYVVRVGGDQIG